MRPVPAFFAAAIAAADRPSPCCPPAPCGLPICRPGLWGCHAGAAPRGHRPGSCPGRTRRKPKLAQVDPGPGLRWRPGQEATAIAAALQARGWGWTSQRRGRSARGAGPPWMGCELLHHAGHGAFEATAGRARCSRRTTGASAPLMCWLRGKAPRVVVLSSCEGARSGETPGGHGPGPGPSWARAPRRSSRRASVEDGYGSLSAAALSMARGCQRGRGLPTRRSFAARRDA